MRGSIERRGKSSWRIKFDIGADAKTGRRKVQRLTVKGKRADAEKKLSQMLAAKGNGSFVEPSKLTVSDYVRERVEHWYTKGDITLRTRERYDDLVDHQIAPQLGDRKVQSLRTLDIEQWHVTLKIGGRADGGGGLSAGTIRGAHGILRKALGEGVKHGLLVRNVCGADGGEKAPQAENSEIEIIQADQIADVVTKLRGRAIYPKAMVSLFMGLRRGEVLALRLGSIDFARKMLKVREAVEQTRGAGLRLKIPKSKAGMRDLVMPNIVVEALSEVRRELLERHMALGLGRPTDDALLFPRLFDGTPQSPSQYSGDWREAVLMLRLPDVSLHALRHTHVSQLIDAGVDIVRIAQRIGHSDPSVTLRIYAHLFRKRDDLSAEAINAALGDIGRT